MRHPASLTGTGVSHRYRPFWIARAGPVTGASPVPSHCRRAVYQCRGANPPRHRPADHHPGYRAEGTADRCASPGSALPLRLADPPGAGGVGRLLPGDRHPGQEPGLGHGHRRRADRGESVPSAEPSSTSWLGTTSPPPRPLTCPRTRLRSSWSPPSAPGPTRCSQPPTSSASSPGRRLWICPVAEPERAALAGGPVLRRPGTRPAAGINRPSPRHPAHAAVRGGNGPAGHPDLAGSSAAAQPHPRARRRAREQPVKTSGHSQK